MERWTLAWILAHVSALLNKNLFTVASSFQLFMVLNFVTYVWCSTGKNSSAEVTWLHGYCTKMNRTVMGCLRKPGKKARLRFLLSLFSQEVSFGKGFSENLLLPLLRTATCLFQLVLVVCSYAVILHKL